MVCRLQRDLDSPDLELVARVMQGVSDVIKAGPTPTGEPPRHSRMDGGGWLWDLSLNLR